MRRRGQVLKHLARQFAFLGATSIGGPAAHIAMMRRRFVERDGDITDADFGRLVGACSLVPGPNSAELAMALGARRAGWRGVTTSSLAVMVVVLWRLGDTTLRSVPSVGVFLAMGLFLLWRERRPQ